MEVWDEIVDGYLELDSSAWLGTPMDTNKFLLVSWRMGGSEFTKELIRENFPETTNINHWAKSHIILNNDISEKLVELGTKVFVVISDPREVALNLVYFDRGMHIGTYDYEMWRYNNITNSKEFFNEVADKQIDLINYYKRVFGDNCIVLRYEDALYYQTDFLNKVSNFLGTEPLGIDDVRKYKRSIYKNVGDFTRFFTEDVLTMHFHEYREFYKEWDYPFKGLHLLKYDWHAKNKSVSKRQVTEDYQKMLKRNGIPPSDRTNHIDEF